MTSDRKVSELFNGKSLAHFLKDFETPKSQKQAIDTLEQRKRATDTARNSFNKVLAKNRPDPSRDLTPQGLAKSGTEKQLRVYKAKAKLEAREQTINRASQNRLERIKTQQELELRVRKSMGRSLSEEFRQRR